MVEVRYASTHALGGRGLLLGCSQFTQRGLAVGGVFQVPEQSGQFVRVASQRTAPMRRNTHLCSQCAVDWQIEDIAVTVQVEEAAFGQLLKQPALLERGLLDDVVSTENRCIRHRSTPAQKSISGMGVLER